MPDDSQLVEETTEATVTELRSCANCRWWLMALVPDQEKQAWGKQTFNFGECRAMPPTALPSDRQYESAGEVGQTRATVRIKQARFPHTFHDDWCGMWASKDTG